MARRLENAVSRSSIDHQLTAVNEDQRIQSAFGHHPDAKRVANAVVAASTPVYVRQQGCKRALLVRAQFTVNANGSAHGVRQSSIVTAIPIDARRRRRRRSKCDYRCQRDQIYSASALPPSIDRRSFARCVQNPDSMPHEQMRRSTMTASVSL